MTDAIDATDLTREQLISLLQVRELAILGTQSMDNQLHAVLASGKANATTFNNFFAAKDDHWAKLATAEEMILAGVISKSS